MRKTPYTLSELDKVGGYTVERKKSVSSAEYYFGTNRDSFSDAQYGFANVAEQWLRIDGLATAKFATTGQSVTWCNDRGEASNALAAEACSRLSQKYSEYETGFMTSSALVYQGEGDNSTTGVVRGVLVVKANVDFNENLKKDKRKIRVRKTYQRHRKCICCRCTYA